VPPPNSFQLFRLKEFSRSNIGSISVFCVFCVFYVFYVFENFRGRNRNTKTGLITSFASSVQLNFYMRIGPLSGACHAAPASPLIKLKDSDLGVIRADHSRFMPFSRSIFSKNYTPRGKGPYLSITYPDLDRP